MSIASTAPAGRVRVVVADGQEVVRRGIDSLLQPHDAVVVVGQAGTVAEALRMVEHTHPDVVLTDTRFLDGSGADLCRRATAVDASVRCVFVSADEDGVLGAAQSGAVGYLLKNVQGPMLVEAVLRAAAGRSWAPDHPAAQQSTPAAEVLLTQLAALTVREVEVLRLITEGLTNRQIGAVLFLSEKTIKNYVSGVLGKLGVDRRAQAAVVGADARELLAAMG